MTVDVNATPGTNAVTSTDPAIPILAAAETSVDPPLIFKARLAAITLIDWSELPSRLRSFVVSE